MFGGPMGGPMGMGSPFGPMGMMGGNWDTPDYNPMPGVTKSQDSMATQMSMYMGGGPMARFLAGSMLDMPDMWWLSQPPLGQLGHWVTGSTGHRKIGSQGNVTFTPNI